MMIAGLLVVTSSAYLSTLKKATIHSPETLASFTGEHNIMSTKIVNLFISEYL
jgi:hypothetical protein